MGRIAKWLAASAGLSVLLGLLGAGGGFLWLRSSLPQIEGTLTLAGLSAPVQVLRDGDGLVTIRAEGEADAAFALGFVHAQDRLWQMDAMRRIVAGRLSEVTGPATLDTDRLMRTLGLYRKAEESLALMAPEIRTLMQAYSDGVNGFLETRSGALPPEFLLLGYEPEPWRPVHSLLWGQIMALRLSGNWRNELLRARLAGQLSEEQIEELWPAEPPDGPITLGAATGDIGPAANAAPDDIGRAAEAAFSLLAGVPQDLLGPGASNSWVLSGAQTASGKPVLANDPHLGFIVPGTWYLVRIETPEGTRAGATTPGVPAIIIGHNGRIAWGFTTTHSDTQDFVIEKFDPTDPKRYLTPEGPLPFQIRDEVIRVKGEDPMVHRVQSTRHGPVLSDVEPDVRRSNEALARQGHAATALALAWPALSHPNRTAEALFRLNRAGDWGEFVEALRLFHGVSSSRPCGCSMRRNRTSSTRTPPATSGSLPRRGCRSAWAMTAAVRCRAGTGTNSGPASSPSRNCPSPSTRRADASSTPTTGSCRPATPIGSPRTRKPATGPGGSSRSWRRGTPTIPRLRPRCSRITSRSWPASCCPCCWPARRPAAPRSRPTGAWHPGTAPWTGMVPSP
jgi:penicillin amidase